MKPRTLEPARLPPAGLSGLDARWSRLVTVAESDGVGRTWHVLDSWADARPAVPRLTLLCVHGNPSWSYLWRRVMAAAPPDIRVIAVDQLDMGFSERTGRTRTLATRIDDLGELTATLGLTGPVVTVAHDWGGPISLGWALRNVGHLAGVVLLNTAVHQPTGSPAPSVIRLTRTPGLLRQITVNTTAFIRGAFEMSRPRTAADAREGFLAPYLSSERREAIADFVEDIPLESGHVSASTLDGIADGLDALHEVPSLLLWGPRDLVFSDLYLHDLERRLPHADVHRFASGAHFVSEDVDVVTPLFDWIEATTSVESGPAPAAAPADQPHRLWEALADRADDPRPAVIEMAPERRDISFRELALRVDRVAAGLVECGVEPGGRVALMIPPGIDLTVALYACLRMGAVIVLVDAGLGPKGMSRAFASANPQHLIGIDKALVAARALRWPGRRFAVGPRSPLRARTLGIVSDLGELATSTAPTPPVPGRDAVAAIVFTSGATGPSKGVVYHHHQVEAQRDALVACYRIQPGDRLVAAFAPFALYGPAMGVTSVVPDMDVTAPGTLTAANLGDAVVAATANLVFASPAALANVAKTSDQLNTAHRSSFSLVETVMSAGAPVRPVLLRTVRELFSNAEIHTPYGMTEVLPVADITLEEIDEALATTSGDGVCVGRPLASVEVRISALDAVGHATGSLTSAPDVVGEIVVRAPHARAGYDRLWHTQHLASQPAGWHRSGDVGHLDAHGRLWVGGRIGHVLTTANGPVTPVAIEQGVESLDEIDMAAIVGIGPAGTQQMVAVVQPTAAPRRPALADLGLLDRVRATTRHDVVAVLVVPQLPVDRRHNSKIDRFRVAEWAEQVLATGRVTSL